jgi:iron(III) transport system substrate-binding protein
MVPGWTRLFQVFLVALGAALACVPAAAQTAPQRTAEIAAYEASDREQRLVEGARREKELTLYSSMPTEDIAALTAAFDKKYGVKVKIWRADSESVLQRILTETRARRFDVDVMVASTSALEPLYRENLLVEVKTPALADLVPGAVAAHRQWAAVYLSTFVQAYNTNIVKAQELPKTFRDLLDPRWRGRLGIEAEDFDWFAQVVMDMGEAEGLALFREIVARNGISVRKGHTLLSNLVAAGEVPVALTVYGFSAEQSKRKGAPLDWFVIPPLIARPTAAGVSKNSPHPHAAVLFYDFLLTDAQAILAGRQFVPASRLIETPFSKEPVKLINSAVMLDQAKKWQDLFQQTIIKQSQ